MRRRTAIFKTANDTFKSALAYLILLRKIACLHENYLIEVHLRHIKGVTSRFNILKIEEYWQNANQFVHYFPLFAGSNSLWRQFKDMVKSHQQAGRQTLTLLYSKQFDET